MNNIKVKNLQTALANRGIHVDEDTLTDAVSDSNIEGTTIDLAHAMEKITPEMMDQTRDLMIESMAKHGAAQAAEIADLKAANAVLESETGRRSAYATLLRERDETIAKLTREASSVAREMERRKAHADMLSGHYQQVDADNERLGVALASAMEQAQTDDGNYEALRSDLNEAQYALDALTRTHNQYVVDSTNAAAAMQTHNVEVERRNIELREVNHGMQRVVDKRNATIAELKEDKTRAENRLNESNDEQTRMKQHIDALSSQRNNLFDILAQIMNVVERAKKEGL